MVNKGIGDENYHTRYYSSRDWRSYRFILDLIMIYAEPGPILDVGSGCGFLVEGASRWGMSCSGLEGSQKAISIALERVPHLEIRHHLLSEKFPFQGGSFQTVVINEVIEHLEKEVGENVLEESFRVLRPGGLLLIFSPGKFNKKEKAADPTHINMYAPKELVGLLRKKGFVDIQSMNRPLPLLGRGTLGSLTMRSLFRLTAWDRLSETANCRAYKPN